MMFNFHFLLGSVDEFRGDKNLIIVPLPSIIFLESAKSIFLATRVFSPVRKREEPGNEVDHL